MVLYLCALSVCWRYSCWILFGYILPKASLLGICITAFAFGSLEHFCVFVNSGLWFESSVFLSTQKLYHFEFFVRESSIPIILLGKYLILFPDLVISCSVVWVPHSTELLFSLSNFFQLSIKPVSPLLGGRHQWYIWKQEGLTLQTNRNEVECQSVECVCVCVCTGYRRRRQLTATWRWKATTDTHCVQLHLTLTLL